MKKTFKVKEYCPSCKGTGIYVGMAESDGAGIVCHNCKGTGCKEFVHEYEEFESRKEKPDISRVFAVNPGVGIGIGRKRGLTLEDFGGIPYKDWLNGMPFPLGSEMRKFSCPAWYYQIANYNLKPEWKECDSNFGRSFSQCQFFSSKELCWDKFDKEQPKDKV